MNGTRPNGTGPNGVGASRWLPARALVVGLGWTGRAAALALARRGVSVVAADRSAFADPGRLGDAGVELRLGSEEESLLDGVELVVKSPGVPGESPLPATARARGIPLWSEIELGYRLLPGNPIVGVTGTKGKTTTARLLGSIYEADGRPVALAGNGHVPLSEVAETLESGTCVVCELSSFALEDVHAFACDVAVLLNVEPDHLDRYASFDHYRAAKLRIFERAGAKIVPRGSGLAGIEFAADDPLPAEPSSPARTTARTQPLPLPPLARQASPTRRSPTVCAISRVSRIGSSSSASCAASAGSTTRRRRTPPLPAAAPRRTPRRSA